MTLEHLLGAVAVVSSEGTLDREITNIEIDSRRCTPGTLFVALHGTVVDGHHYVAAAIKNGACAIVYDCPLAEKEEGVTYIQVAETAQAVGPLATTFYGAPSRRLTLVGVTGTNGKTTIATLLYHLFRKLGHRCGLLSTVCNYVDGAALPADHTTPDAVALNRLLAQMVAAGCEYVFMECSSHAIAQQRIGGLHFAVAIFTNLTRDHIDYHLTVDNYLRAKKKLFDSLDRHAFALVNADDKHAKVMTQNTRAKVVTYGVQALADYHARILECHFEGMYLDIDHHEVGVQFIGRFNASNLLAIYGAARLLGKNSEEILVALSTFHSVRGRLEYIRSSDGKIAVVDYAHTPDALRNVISTLREVLAGKGRLLTVCGCGGDRDKGKRPLMAQEAAHGSALVILTDDNPRTEASSAILDDMEAGLTANDKKKVLRIADRAQAIRTAVAMAAPGDVILIAGKGHEDYQIIGTVKHHFDDKEVVAAAFGQLA